MLLLSLDAETTGLDFEKDRIIEIGLIMWDIDARQPVRLVGHFIKPKKSFSQQDWSAAEAIHKISIDIVDKYGMPEDKALQQLATWYEMTDIIVGHNAVLFDKPMIEAWAARGGVVLPKKHWIDTRVDLPCSFSGKLTHLAAEHNFLNPFSHRALFDAMTCLKILDQYDIPTVIARSRMPNVLVEAVVSFADKDRAKERGYYWKPWRGKNKWLKTLKDTEVGREQAEAGFRVVVLETCYNGL